MALSHLGHTHGDVESREPKAVYENPTGRRVLRFVPVPATALFAITFIALYLSGSTVQGSGMAGAALGGMTGIVFFIAVRVAVVPRARLKVYERIFETKNPRLKHQGMHIVSAETRGSYVFVTMETGEVHAVLSGEPQRAKQALLDLRKRARET